MTGYLDLESAILQGDGIERSYVCQNHPDHNASASVNVLTGLFYCYACGHKGKVDLSTVALTSQSVARMAHAAYRSLQHQPRLSESWLNLFDGDGPGDYWLGRFSAETCRYLRLGHGPGVATYPLRDEAGRVLGVVERDLTGEGPKYRYPARVKVSEHLIEAWRCEAETILLVEGMADVAAIHDTGHRAALGTYKAMPSAAQIAVLKRYAPRRVFCAYDMDEAGDKGWQVLRSALRAYCSVQRLFWDTYNDVADIPLSERTEMLDEVLGKKRVDRLVNVA
jgi:DNA primase